MKSSEWGRAALPIVQGSEDRLGHKYVCVYPYRIHIYLKNITEKQQKSHALKEARISDI